MRRLNRSEIEAGGNAMPRIMRFHDNLIGSKLVHVSGRRGATQPPPVMHFTNDATLRTQYDDEGNPGATEWQVTDREGYMYHPIQVRDLVGHRVTSVGYFHDPENCCRHVIPFVEIASTFLVCCMTPHGGGVISHDRPGEDHWDLFCQFKPKL